LSTPKGAKEFFIISHNVSAYEKFGVSQIWVERGATERNLISRVIFPEGLKFSATSRREISEPEVGRSSFLARAYCLIINGLKSVSVS